MLDESRSLESIEVPDLIDSAEDNKMDGVEEKEPQEQANVEQMESTVAAETEKNNNNADVTDVVSTPIRNTTHDAIYYHFIEISLS